jgi:hypothetical protein
MTNRQDGRRYFRAIASTGASDDDPTRKPLGSFLLAEGLFAALSTYGGPRPPVQAGHGLMPRDREGGTRVEAVGESRAHQAGRVTPGGQSGRSGRL